MARAPDGTEQEIWNDVTGISSGSWNIVPHKPNLLAKVREYHIGRYARYNNIKLFDLADVDAVREIFHIARVFRETGYLWYKAT